MAGIPWCALARIETPSRHSNSLAHARHSRLEYPSRTYPLCAFEAGLVLCRRLKDLRASGRGAGGGGDGAAFCILHIQPGPALAYAQLQCARTLIVLSMPLAAMTGRCGWPCVAQQRPQPMSVCSTTRRHVASHCNKIMYAWYTQGPLRATCRHLIDDLLVGREQLHELARLLVPDEQPPVVTAIMPTMGTSVTRSMPYCLFGMVGISHRTFGPKHTCHSSHIRCPARRS
jgi:hypothetical protein